MSAIGQDLFRSDGTYLSFISNFPGLLHAQFLVADQTEKFGGILVIERMEHFKDHLFFYE
jgi:hypothetical protein